MPHTGSHFRYLIIQTLLFLLVITFPVEAQEESVERSGSGAPIYRHTERKRPEAPPNHHTKYLEQIEVHVEKHIGTIETVFHEITSDLVHIDVLFIPATVDRPYHVLVTSGVSDEPMNVPEGLDKFRRVELLIGLPGSWPLTQKAFEDEKNYWPIRLLKSIGRLPHIYDTWIGWGHTIHNGNPPELIADTGFIGTMLTPAFSLPEDFYQLKANDGETITFYALHPLYPDELNLKLEKGSEALEDLLEQGEVTFVVEKGRPDVTKK